MGKIASFVMVTLNGFHEGPNPWELEWHNTDEEFNDFALEQLDDFGTLVFGRATYLGMAQYWPSAEALESDPAVAGKMNGAPKIVVSRTLDEAEWSNTRILRDPNGLARLKQEPGQDLLVLGSSVLTTSLMEMGILDELRVMVNPVLIGSGTALSSTARRQIPLKLLSIREFRNGNVLLTYEPLAERRKSA